MNLHCLVFGHICIPTGKTSILGYAVLVCQRCGKTTCPRIRA